MQAGQLFSVPSQERIDTSKMEIFRKYINQRTSQNLRTPWDLHAWSTSNTSSFWLAIWDYFHLVGDLHGSLPLFDSETPMHLTKRRITASLNFAENLLLAHPHARSSERIAVHGSIEARNGDSGHLRSLTWAELYAEVGRAAAALARLGVKQGDR